MAELVGYEFRAPIAHVTLDNPAKRNALTAATLAQLRKCLDRARADDTCRALVLAANGEDFCAGMDLDAVADADAASAMAQDFWACLQHIHQSRYPVVAAVDGKAMGGGLGLAAACDLVIASPQASFSTPEAVIGMVPALIAPFLQRRLSPARLRYLALSTRSLTAAEAHIYGIVDEVAEPSLERALARQLKRLRRSSPQALARIKEYTDQLAPPLQKELALETLSDWIERPETRSALVDFSQGLTPPWFGR